MEAVCRFGQYPQNHPWDGDLAEKLTFGLFHCILAAQSRGGAVW
jgi:hypothetical protein